MLLYFIPGIIAIGGSAIYYSINSGKLELSKLVKLISIFFYAIATISYFVQAIKLFRIFNHNLRAIMSGEFSLNFPIKAFIFPTIFVVLATLLCNLSKKLDKKKNEEVTNENEEVTNDRTEE